MAEFPCPYCGHAVATDAEGSERCPSCGGNLLIAYRYRLVARRGQLSSGELYEARDDGFDERVAVLFAKRDIDEATRERFIEGNRLFAELGGGRGLVRIHELGARTQARPYVVMDWIVDGTLESRVSNTGPLDMPTLIETAADLLTGLAKAHRSMPSIVHNHIHPGKIGFLSDDEIVMFGFEWAEQVFEQDSVLADAFIEQEAKPLEGVRRAADLRQLGHALVYAASGEWIAELSSMQQRGLVRERVQGPMALLLDRLLDAGASGYRTAVDAVMDLNHLLRDGHSNWRPRTLPKQTQIGDLEASAWSEASLEQGASELFELEDIDEQQSAEPELDAYEYEEYYEDEDEAEDDAAFGDEPIAQEFFDRPSSAVGAFPTPAQPSFDQQAYAQLQAQLDNQREEETQQGGRVLGVVMALVLGSGMCVAAIAEDSDDDYEAERIRQEIADMVAQQELAEELEAIAREQERLELEAAQRELEAAAAASVETGGTFDSIYRYEGTITGPQDIAGAYRIGDSCEIWVEPANLPDLNCRWYIDCKRGQTKRRIYGGGTAGYSSCEIAPDGSPLRAQDEEDDIYDGAFVAELGGPHAMIMVMDRWLEKPTRLAITVVGEGERWNRRVPNVRRTKRASEDEIAAKIALDEYPSFPENP